MELNREQIIKALEFCENNYCDACEDCASPPNTGDNCVTFVMRNALSLINELTEENERLSGAVKQYEEERKYHFEMSRTRIAEAEADTVRKMQDALEQRIHSKLSYHGWYLKETVIAEVVKEMLEGHNGI